MQKRLTRVAFFCGYISLHRRNKMKTLIAYAVIATSAVLFTFGPAHAFMNDGFVTNGNNNAQFDSKGDAEARGTANFTMSFSGSGTTKGNFNANGATQNLIDGRDVYRPPYYGNPNYNFPAEK
jgi:hypothetical protein